MRAWLLLTVLALVLAGAMGGVSPTAATDGGSPTAADGGTLTATDESVLTGADGISLASNQVDADRVVMEANVRADGSAHWTIEHRVRLTDANETGGFEATREQLADNRTAFRAPFADRVRSMATRAEAETGRVMVVENVTVDAYREQIPQEYGVVVYEFVWYGFAEIDDDLRVGDALPGLFLDEETTLLVSWPGDATAADVTPESDDRRETAVAWHGPLDFATGEPSLVLESERLSFGPDLSFDTGSTDVLMTLGGAGLLLMGTLGTGVVVWRRRSAGPAEAETDDGTGAEEVDETEEEADEGAEPGEEGDEGPMEPPEELLSNEERVLALLEERGGRIKQQQIVEALDWSETKTSEVVADLREENSVEVYRLGRENVVALPETGLIDSEDGPAEGER